jgi:hypothetical protein
MALGPISALRLRMILQRPANPTHSPSQGELQDTSEQRLNDYNEVLDILEKSRGDGLDAEFQWTEEYLNTAGSTVNELAHLLVNDKYDSPWVLRPPYTKLFAGEQNVILPQNPPAQFYSAHSAACGHNSNTLGVRSLSQDGARCQLESRLSTIGKYIQKPHPASELLLGIAGYVPMCHDQVSNAEDDSTLEELWMQEIRQHTRTRQNDKSVITVFYGPNDDFTQESFSRQFLEVAEQALQTLILLNNAVISLRMSEFMCDSLPILWKVDTGSVQVINMSLHQVEFLYNCVSAIVDNLKKEIGRENLVKEAHRNPSMKADADTEEAQAPANASMWLRILAEVILWVVWGLVSAFPLLDSVATRVRATLAPFTQSDISTEHRPLPRCFQELRVAHKRFLDKLGVKIFRSITVGFDDFIDDPASLGFVTPFMVQTLHHTTTCIQILCLGLQSFVQSHVGMPHFSIMDREAKEVYLDGCRFSGLRQTGGRIVAHLQDLTCFGDMIKSPVLVFQDCPETLSFTLGNEAPYLYDGTPCDLNCSLEDIIYIWGDRRSGFADTDTSEAPSTLTYISIGRGILYETHDDGQLWHWMSEKDPAFSRTIETLQKTHRERSIQRQEKIRVGAMSVNQQCPLSSGEGQRVLYRMLRDHIKSLQAFAPYWELESKQGGISGGQYVVPQFMLGWNKVQGHTEKQNLLNPCNNTLLPELSNLYGLQVSLCTGLLYRVPLQKLIASRMKSYIKSRGPPVREWFKLEKTWGISKAFDQSDLQQWFHELPEELHEAAWLLVREILYQLQHTGIDQENNLRIGWAQENTALKCLKIKCGGHNSWAKILTDSPDTVTFACVEPICMQSPSLRHRCPENLPPKPYNPCRPFQLHTKVRPLCVVDDPAVVWDKWTLQPGQNYWIGPQDLMMLAEANLKGEVWQLSVRQSKMPAHLFRRINNRVMLRETNDEGAVECFVGVRETFAQEDAVDQMNVASVPLTASRVRFTTHL